METIRNRYLLQQALGEGGMGMVYRAYDRLTAEVIALKRVTISGKKLDFSTLTTGSDYHLALAHEFRTLASLRHPNIISVLDYGFDANRLPYFTMDLLPDAQNLVEAAQHQPPAQQIHLLKQLLHALIYLHRRNVLHRDLKPGNVLVVNEQVKVLDFGISVARQHLPDNDNRTSGTLAYMAPEVAGGDPATELSDLYAVGVMAYQIAAGKHPFRIDNPNELIVDVLRSTPNWTAIADHPLCLWIARLMEKDPASRYPDAQAALNALSQSHKRDTIETMLIRESFLQAAQFVGRDPEFQQLTTALTAVHQRQGSLWLVGGESGVGKSRLLDELRTHALVQGVQVLRGQAISEGSAPYTLWRDVLSLLALQPDLSGFEASVLKAILPDLETLLQRPISDAPEAEPRAAQERLIQVIVEIFRRQSEPLMVLLEDVQWARESLVILKSLAQAVADLPLLIIASYRDDEMPNLPQELPTAQRLHLERLSETQISELSASILGEASGRNSQLVKLLQRETEGNVFFIVEVIRALAEDAGQLADIGTKTFPAHIFTGGIQAVVQRRLQRVPADYVPLLQAAAIAGREIDTTVLQTLQPQVDLVNWLNVCANCAVLDVQENQWRFAHDKLREGILEGLTALETQRLHQQVAEALEQSPFHSAAALAYHWSAAENPAKAAEWSIQAGEEATRNGALQDALSFLNQAQRWQSVLELPPHVKARTYRLMARILFGMGHLPESTQAAHQGLNLLGLPLPQSTPGLAAGIVWQSIRQALHLMGLHGWRQRQPEIWLEALKIVRILSEVYVWSRGLIHIIYLYIWGLNLAERIGAQPITVPNYTGPSYFLSLTPFKRLSDLYQAKAQRISEASGDPLVQSDVLFVEGLRLMHAGRLADAMAAYTKGAQLVEPLGDMRRLIIQRGQYLGVLYLSGDYPASLQWCADLLALSRQQHNLQYVIWALGGTALMKLRQGDPAGAIPVLEEADAHLKQAKDALARTFILGQMALAHLRLDDFEQAEAVAERLRKQVFYSRPTGHAALEGYPALVEVYFTLWQRDPQNKTLAKNARLALKALQRYAGIFAVGKPRAALWQGKFAAVDGKPALPHYRRALHHAEQLGMQYDIGLAHWTLGQYLPAGEREHHLRAAQAIFEKIGAIGELHGNIQPHQAGV